MNVNNCSLFKGKILLGRGQKWISLIPLPTPASCPYQKDRKKNTSWVIQIHNVGSDPMVLNYNILAHLI